MAAGGSTRTVLTALFANAGIAVAKFIGFMITRSTSMLTESVHSLADTSNQALLLLGGRQARKAASLEHPFGYGRERYFWSFVVAMILFSLGGLFAIYEGWEKVQHPHELDAPIVAIIILVFGLGLEGYAFRTAKEEAEKVKGPTTTWARFIRRSRNPELPVVLLEDAGALIGLLLALFGVLGAWFIDPVLDGYATLAIGLLLLIIAVVLAVEMKSLLIGEAAVPEDRDRLIGAIEGHRDVHSLLHLRTQHIGPDELLVGAKVHFRPSLTTASLSAAINETEAAMRAAVPIARVIYIEPDLTNSPSATMGTLAERSAYADEPAGHHDDAGDVVPPEPSGSDPFERTDDSRTAATATMPPPPTQASIRYDDDDNAMTGTRRGFFGNDAPGTDARGGYFGGANDAADDDGAYFDADDAVTHDDDEADDYFDEDADPWRRADDPTDADDDRFDNDAFTDASPTDERSDDADIDGGDAADTSGDEQLPKTSGNTDSGDSTTDLTDDGKVIDGDVIESDVTEGDVTEGDVTKGEVIEAKATDSTASDGKPKSNNASGSNKGKNKGKGNKKGKNRNNAGTAGAGAANAGNNKADAGTNDAGDASSSGSLSSGSGSPASETGANADDDADWSDAIADKADNFWASKAGLDDDIRDRDSD